MNAYVVLVKHISGVDKEGFTIEKNEEYLVHATTPEQAKSWLKQNIDMQDRYFGYVSNFNLNKVVKL